MINVAVLGFGVVGSGVVELIEKNAETINKGLKEQIKVKKILDIRDFEGHKYQDLFTKDFDEILNDDEISIVIETIGGKEPARTFTEKALKKGKSVVTSNKELVAAFGSELMVTAKENNSYYMFEASVGGAIPVLRPLGTCLAANNITDIWGILNGTTNYILTRMFEGGASFEDALKEAQQKGYAERDPSADVEGHDTMRKIAILMAIASGYETNCDKIMTEGITSIKQEDVKILDKAGYAIRLIGHGKVCDKKVFARVSPMVISKNHPLAGVKDVFNAVMVMGDATDEVMFYGKGAGKFPTASAVVADVIDIAKFNGNPPKYSWEKPDADMMIDIEDTSSMFYVRATGITKQDFDVLEIISEQNGEIAFITSEMNEKAFIAAKKQLELKGAEFKAVIRKLL
ncbi:MAG: homoserine dehydrogenase [Clostridia bacterium]|nr:homoserine dehydrogenase [Clostridia bacterium]